MDTVSMAVVLILTWGLSCFFSAAHTAFSKFSKSRIKALAGDGDERAKRVLTLDDHKEALRSAIHVGSVLSGVLMTMMAVGLFAPYRARGVMAAVAAGAGLVLLVGETAAKAMAQERPEGFMMASSGALAFFMGLFKPLESLFMAWSRFIAHRFASPQEEYITEDEIKAMVDEAESEGSLVGREGELIRSAIEFNDLEVADILTPRVDVVAVEENTPLKEVSAIFEEHGYSRLPVYEESLDKIVGIIHEKDFYANLHKGKSTLTDMMKRPVFISPTLKISQLLQLLQHAQTHMAVVVDEFGGTAGIVTLEDILEELVGEIWDEHDEVMVEMRPMEDGSFVVAGSASVDKLFRHLGMDYDIEWATVNGWVMDKLGCIPVPGQRFVDNGLEVTVTQADTRKVLEVKIRRLDTQDSQQDSEKKSAVRKGA